MLCASYHTIYHLQKKRHNMKMSSKVSATLCMATFFLLFFTLTHAARPGPAASSTVTPKVTQFEVLEVDKVNMEESCEGIGEEECLMRRTLAAHVDYIYTQKHKP
ncbi:hypothetical protein L6164_035801 [Bauhinia variegata]|uniref:Uncharacterized protein n=1 Tax=Bauhinia variegata TaxID=167791 RepID=A0ACB9KF38_BAUVA|nr:hypothetical protein L6164_035801 [Bauhinia variegata]